MHKNNFVIAVKSNNQILREQKDTVYLPFGSEYSLYLKNLDSRDALINISIDGESCTECGIVLAGNNCMDLEGFLKGATAHNKFKFIKKTKEIVEHRGDLIDDGIIRIEFKFEQKREAITRGYTVYYPHVPYWPWSDTDSTSSMPTSGTVTFYSDISFTNNANQPQINQDEGITVQGSPTRQEFKEVSIGDLEEQSTVITLRLKGTKEGTVLVAPITTKTKVKCSTCGREYKVKDEIKYCSGCGAYLLSGSSSR